MLLPMAVAHPPIPTPHSRKYRGRKKLLVLIEALRPLGLSATVPELASALSPMQEGKWGLRISREMLDSILRDVQHQALINEVLLRGFKRDGYETTYRDLYPDYQTACALVGIRPLSFKTFANRALRENRWGSSAQNQDAPAIAQNHA